MTSVLHTPPVSQGLKLFELCAPIFAIIPSCARTCAGEVDAREGRLDGVLTAAPIGDRHA